MATPIVSARTISCAPSLRKSSTRPETTAGSTRPSKGQPNATLIVTVVFAGRAVAILEARFVASSSVAFAFRWLKLSVAPSVTLTRSSPDAGSVEAFLVQHQSHVLDTVGALDLADDVLRGGHLRDRVVPHEAHYLDPS